MSNTEIKELKVGIPGGQVYVKKWIPEFDNGKPPIILLHDSLGCVDLWKDFPEMLSKVFCRVVFAYDRLGFGRSDARSSLPSKDFIEEEASIYFPSIKETLGIDRYVLLGHSVGGGMAINIASQDNDCQAVITVSAQAFVEDLTIKGIEDARKIFEQPGQIGRLEKWHGSKAEWVLHAWTDVWLSDEFKDWSLEPAIHNVQCPVLAIHGDNDEYGSSAFPQFIFERSGGSSTMLILDNCGHMPHKEKKQEVISAVKEFLNAIA